MADLSRAEASRLNQELHPNLFIVFGIAELVDTIVEDLPRNDLIALSQTCRSLRTGPQNSPIFRTKLFTAGHPTIVAAFGPRPANFGPRNQVEINKQLLHKSGAPFSMAAGGTQVHLRNMTGTTEPRTDFQLNFNNRNGLTMAVLVRGSSKKPIALSAVASCLSDTDVVYLSSDRSYLLDVTFRRYIKPSKKNPQGTRDQKVTAQVSFSPIGKIIEMLNILGKLRSTNIKHAQTLPMAAGKALLTQKGARQELANMLVGDLSIGKEV